MSNQTKAAPAPADDMIVEGDKAAPKSKKKLILIAAAAGVLVLGGGGTAGFLLLGGGGAEAAAEEGHAVAAEGDHGEAAAEGGGGHGGGEEEGKSPYVDVPAMVVNLRSPDGASRFLKVHVMLVPGPKGGALKDKLPMIQDGFQPFLRELRPEDLAGSAAVYRIKEELLIRANGAAGAGSVKDVLIQDLVQQ